MSAKLKPMCVSHLLQKYTQCLLQSDYSHTVNANEFIKEFILLAEVIGKCTSMIVLAFVISRLKVCSMWTKGLCCGLDRNQKYYKSTYTDM